MVVIKVQARASCLLFNKILHNSKIRMKYLTIRTGRQHHKWKRLKQVQIYTINRETWRIWSLSTWYTIPISKEYPKTTGQTALRATKRKTILVQSVLTSLRPTKSLIFKAFSAWINFRMMVHKIPKHPVASTKKHKS